MKKIFKEHKLWAGIAGYAAIIVLIFWFLVFPILGKIRFGVDEAQRRAIDIELSRARISKIGEMENAIKVFTEKEKDLDIMLHPDEEVQFIRSLETLAEETGNKIDIKIKEKEKEKEKVKEAAAKGDIRSSLPYKDYLSVEVNLEGDYNGLLDFVCKIEAAKWCAGIISVKAEGAEKSEGAGKATSFSTGLFSGNSKISGNAGKKEKVLKTAIDLAVCVKK